MAGVLLWWRSLPPWARWTVGLLVLLVAGVAWGLLRGLFAGPSPRQVRSAVEAEGAAEGATRAAGEAGASEEAEVFAGELSAAVAEAGGRAAAEDAGALEKATDAGGAAARGDGTTDLGGGVRGGSLDGR